MDSAESFDEIVAEHVERVFRGRAKPKEIVLAVTPNDSDRFAREIAEFNEQAMAAGHPRPPIVIFDEPPGPLPEIIRPIIRTGPPKKRRRGEGIAAMFARLAPVLLLALAGCASTGDLEYVEAEQRRQTEALQRQTSANLDSIQRLWGALNEQDQRTSEVFHELTRWNKPDCENYSARAQKIFGCRRVCK